MTSGEPNEKQEAGSKRSKLFGAGLLILILGAIIEILGLVKVLTINDITRTGIVVMVIGLVILLFSFRKHPKST